MRVYVCALFALLLATTCLAAAPLKSGCPAWSDDFSGTALNPNHWLVGNGQAPGYIAGVHRGYYRPANVRVINGFLRLALNQSEGTVDGKPGVVSSGALITSVLKCGYGTYEWKMRMSSTATSPGDPSGVPISGSVSAGFNYINNSQSEIDFEYSALTPDRLWMVNWLNTHPSTDPTGSQETASFIQISPYEAMHTYKFIWAPGSVTFYVDGVRTGVHTTNVPSVPANVMINHWGTNSSGWGGLATLKSPRCLYVDRFSYSPTP
jgi:endo-1,3-1,4-beta-glycanase ExoK